MQLHASTSHRISAAPGNMIQQKVGYIRGRYSSAKVDGYTRA